jgi:hypothetical protein
MPRVISARQIKTCPNLITVSSDVQAITPAEVARITWVSLPSAKVGPVALEPKPFFVLTGGDRNQNSPARP